MKIAKAGVLAILLMLCMCGCFLLPEEAKVPELPLVTPYAGDEFVTAYVTRGNMTLKETINCLYSATKSETLSFRITGADYGSVFVDTGDYVTAGTLVAELDVSSILEDMKSVGNDIAKLEVELDEEYKALDLTYLTEELNGGTSTVSSDAKKASIAYKESKLDIFILKKAELEQKLEERRLYAGINGTVTYVKKIKDGLKSSKNDNVVIITDMDSSVFIASTELYDLFKPGQEVIISSEGTAYTTVFTAAEQLGLKEQIDGSGRKTVYFTVTGSEAPSKSGAKGSVELFLDSREDVLMIPSKAVFTVDGQSMVYYQDENGVKSAKEIECGLKADGFIEITGGLNEGDCVIIN
jgi:multidrug efflux pump subunit AcrA (membrane-fusion protein)